LSETPQLTKRNCDLQINVGLHDYKDRNQSILDQRFFHTFIAVSNNNLTKDPLDILY